MTDFVIDCAQPFVPNIDIERQDGTTGDLTPTDVTGVTLVLAVVRGSLTPIHANLSQPASVRSGRTGRIYATFAVDDLQSFVKTPFTGKKIFLNMFKDDVYVGQSFVCYVQPDRMRPNP